MTMTGSACCFVRPALRRGLNGNPLALGFLDAAEAAELQALCDLNPQATGYLRRICDALGGGLNPCRERGVTCSAFTRSGLALADGHLLQL